MKKVILVIGLCLSMSSSAQSQSSIDFCYSDLSKPQDLTGTEKAETYDIAIWLDAERFAGKSVEGVIVPLPEVRDISACRVWLSKKLSATVQGGKSVNNPDILSMPVKLNNGRLSASFPEKYTIDNDGVYVGYTFTVESVSLGDAASTPVAVTRPAISNGFFVHTSASYPIWREGGSEWNATSMLQVKLEGDFPQVDVEILPEAGQYNVKAEEQWLPIDVKIVTYGVVPLSELTFSYSADSQNGSVSISPENAEHMQWGCPSTVEVRLPITLKKGSHDINLVLEQANGIKLSGERLHAVAHVDALEYVPEHRPLMEEYTGLWCGACPRGLAAMQYMEKKYPGHFIAVSYHNNDDMMVMESSDYPYPVSALPAAWFDREQKIDPYMGTKTKGFGLEEVWLDASSHFTPADISVQARWEDETHTMISAVSDINFIKDADTRCSVEFTLIADGLVEPNWRQHNYYAGVETFNELEEMKPFIEGGSIVSGIIFDGVVAATSRLENNMTEPFYPKMDKTETCRYTFDCSKILSMTGYDIIGKAKKLRIVASVIDESTGRILNSALSDVMDYAAIPTINHDNVTSIEYYNLQGFRIERPTGIYIERKTYKDGSIETNRRFQ